MQCCHRSLGRSHARAFEACPLLTGAVQTYRLIIASGAIAPSEGFDPARSAGTLPRAGIAGQAKAPMMAGVEHKAAGLACRHCSLATGSHRLHQKPAPRVCPSRHLQAVTSGPSASAPSIERPILLNGQVRIRKPALTPRSGEETGPHPCVFLSVLCLIRVPPSGRGCPSGAAAKILPICTCCRALQMSRFHWHKC